MRTLPMRPPRARPVGLGRILARGWLPVVLAAAAGAWPAPASGGPPAALPGPVTAALAAISTAVCPAPTYGVKRSAPGAGRTVALTFDDGPGASTAALLSVLQRYGVPATFFNVGASENTRPQLLRAEVTLGLALGNHTWSHPHLTTLTATGQASEMDRANAAQAALVNQPNCLFRPPYGEYNTTTLDLAYNRRMAVWTWSVDTEDWKAAGSGSQYWIDRIVSRAVAGGSQLHPVILMHNQGNGNPATVAALPSIISYYRSHGYTFVDLLGRAGVTLAAPATVTTFGGLQLFVRRADGTLARRSRTAAGWSGWTSLGGQAIDGPAAVRFNSTTAAVFVQGTDNQLYWQTVTDSGTRSGWVSLGGVLMSKPSATIDGTGVLSVAARGVDGRVWLRERRGGTWGAWTSAGGVLTSAPGAATTLGTELSVAGAGTNNGLWVRHRAATWSAWTAVGGYLTAEPALTPLAGGGGLAALVRGTDKAMYLKVGNASAATWGGWTRLGGVLTSAPAATVNGSTIDVFGYGTDGRIYENLAANGASATGWSGWRPLPS
jgi:peptidoglycan/xylan/chitin deacetylase (PgdA/CDA1 family)